MSTSGILVILAMSAVGILGIILGGWSSNSHYPLLGALRSAAQLVSYEVALSFALLSGLMVAGTLSMQGIVQAQQARGIWFVFANYGFMIVPFVVYLISATAETNRAPFDLPEAESELVAGFHTEYSGFRWALYFLAEYANIFVVSQRGGDAVLGRLAAAVSQRRVACAAQLTCCRSCCSSGSGAQQLPAGEEAARSDAAEGAGRAWRCCCIGVGVLFLVPPFNSAAIGVFWFLFKVALIIYLLIWFRGTFPRFRYDQLMNIGWKYMIPIGMGAMVVNALLGMV